jgi:hypothetical protein
MQLQFVTTTSLDKKLVYVIHYWWHPLIVDNQVAFAIAFTTIPR